MISHSNRLNCKSARLSYYDLLGSETEADVPEDVRRHIASCRHCQADISRLKTLLADTGQKNESEQSRKDSVISSLLSLHFAWIDKPVTCKSARLFLPSLADPLLKITIPTPITVHIDHCRSCSDELSNLKNSGFTHKQLCRLGRIMAEKPAEDAERGDSEIATCFTLREADDRSAETEASEMYSDWPIDVQVLNQEGLEDTKTAASSAPGQKALILNLKRHIRPAIAAAAVILIGFALFFGTSAATAVSLARICSTVKGARNVHITEFVRGRTEPEREQWVSRSRSLSIYMLKVGQERTLWDLRAAPKRIESSNNIEPKVVLLSEAEVAPIRTRINSTLGIVPSEAPVGSKWSKVTDVVLDAGTQGCEVYDLTWTQSDSLGRQVPNRWRVFVNPRTNRAYKTQFWRKLQGDDDYHVESEYEIEYPSDDDMKTVIERASL